MKDLAEAVEDVVEIIEQLYILRIEDLTKKLENIRRINTDLLGERLLTEVKTNNISTKKDIVRYIESIIPD